MDLWRISVSTTSEAADAVSAVLEPFGGLAADIEDIEDIRHVAETGQFGEWVDESTLDVPSEGARVNIYVAQDAYPEATLAKFLASVEEALISVRESGLVCGSLRITHEAVLSAEYLDAWKAHYHAIAVSEQLAVVPSWEMEHWQGTPGQIPLVIDPGVAFGTGTHETTILCLRALSSLIHSDMRLLDVGTGTGILGIAAAKLGAKRVLAVDLDERAVEIARENVVLNGVTETVAILCSDLVSAVPGGKCFDLITANLLAGIVIRLLPDARQVLSERGILVASGIVARQVPEVTDAMRLHGFSRIEEERLGDWVVLIGYLCG